MLRASRKARTSHGCCGFFSFVLLLCFQAQKGRVNSLDFCSNNDTALQLIDNGYQTLQIRIADDVPENYDVLTNLENLLTEFSKTLFRVSKRRAYLRTVKISLPRSWRETHKFGKRVESESSDSQSSAHIWIRNSSPRENNPQNIWMPLNPTAFIVRPYTVKATPCGHPGTYLRLSPEFILFGNETNVTEQIGSPDMIMVKEWAKLRWGVYDEVPRDPIRESYYHYTNREILPTVCSSAIQGANVNMTSPQNECNLEEAVRNGGCRFEPHEEQSDTSFSSLLYRTDLPFVQEFCDDEDEGRKVPKELLHANVAPTKQNLHCESRSIWSVMRSHVDFAGERNLPLNVSEPPSVNFEFTRFYNERIVLVLDVSSSMLAFGRLGLMQQAVGYFIDTAPMNTWIGIVCFAREGVIRRELEQITDDDKRRWLKEQSICSVKMGTSIGGGIWKALQVLSQSGPRDINRNKGGKMIILTDGEEHFRPSIREVLPLVIIREVTVTTIAFGGQVAKDLELLAHETNGRIYAASSGEYGIDSELQEAFLSQQDYLYGGAISIFSDEATIPTNATIDQFFVIDSSIGRNTLITIFYKENIQAYVTLTSPDGEILTNDSTEIVRYSVDTNLNITYIRILNVAESGNWTLTLSNPLQTRPMILRISVVSYQRQDQEPLGVSPGLLCRTVNLTGGEALVIYVYVGIGELAVLDATVGAIITRPLSNDLVDTSELILSDNGLDPDITANDGVYSGYFVEYTASGRYIVKVYANNDDSRAYLNENFLLGVGNIDFPLVSFNTRNQTEENYIDEDLKNLIEQNFTDENLRNLLQQNLTRENVTNLVDESLTDENLKNLMKQNFTHETLRNFPKQVLTNENSRTKRSTESRQRRNVRRNMPLGDFRRESSVAGAFVVQNFPKDDDLCSTGYRHFQNFCYKVVNRPLQSFDGAGTVCRNDGSDLAVVNSQQALSWLIRSVPRSAMVWFGGIGQDLRRSGNLFIQRITAEVRRDVEDQDLNDLINHLYTHEEEDLAKFLHNFSPNLDSLSNLEINRLLAALGLESVEDLKNLNESLQQDSLLSRKKRQISDMNEFTTTDSAIIEIFGTDENMQMSIDEDDLLGTTMANLDQNLNEVTLGAAIRQPKEPQLEGSGESTPTCFWFQNRNIIESSDEVCGRPARFICKKPVRDRHPPSRILDLQASFSQENNSLTLQWSAPGDDLSEGRASGYVVRILGTQQAPIVLESNFSRGENLSLADYPANSNFPSYSGSKEVVELNITEYIGCPPHAILDVIFALPGSLISQEVLSEKKLISQFVLNIVNQFKVDEFNIQFGAFAYSPTNAPLFEFNSFLNQTIMENLLYATEGNLSSTSNFTMEDTISYIIENGGRPNAPKVLLVLTDENFKPFSNVSFIDVTMIVTITSVVDKKFLWSVASAPGCKNSFIVEDIVDLPRVSSDVVTQLCEARSNELQAVAVRAFDDAGQSGRVSNVVSFVVRYSPIPAECIFIEPTTTTTTTTTPAPTTTAAPVAGASATTIGLGIGIPFTTILIIVGSVMLFGQVKKQMKKRKDKKRRKEEEAKIKAMKEARLKKAKKRAAAKNSNNNSNVFKMEVFENWGKPSKIHPMA